MGTQILQPCSRKRKVRDGHHNIDEVEGHCMDVLSELPGIPMVPSNQNMKSRVIFVLDKASLTLALVGKCYQILNQEKHADFLRKKRMDPYRYRPDILHEALVHIMHSRICMAGIVEAVFIKTDGGILIRVDPRTRIPESLDEFCDMMSQLLQKFSTKAKGKRGKLLQLVKNPITQYLPINCVKIGLTSSSTKVVEPRDYFTTFSNDVNFVFVIGAMGHDKIDVEGIDEVISVSGHHLSARVCLRMIYESLAKKYGIW
ncbi:ribosomal RNA small subunit methyltransferase NEP1-like [Momordica charantia]|uniref:Ribosomal RNA small subunit methyltransferase NEP1-like n=1 Tax=Momordica charantia TaxID=3673 RepID=A0A6J1DAB0_MOMCH|nr:ribosomal RNA small subunit methyltransferase NEP1-like [Momordica charantia]XP_022150057.1 ribosomal RNA small subunit methyltransferase NEP1-like [Momordica charantia]